MRRLLVIGCLLVACDGPTTEPAPSGGSAGSASTGPTSGADASATDDDATGDPTRGPVDTGSDGTGSSDDAPSTFGGDLPAYCPPGAEPSLEMGLGDVEFRPLGDEVAQLVMGHQGGYHVVLGLRGAGLDLADWGSGHLHASIGGTVVADFDTIIVMNCDEGGQFAEALWLNLIFDADPEDLVGQLADVEVEFTDASGVVVSASGQVRISDDIVHA
ncbi:MAG: hypothetical protein KDK70_07220 [Myxococcales bacterium]|nr:hypothetical protein [Myxococcales bacterium]